MAIRLRRIPGVGLVALCAARSVEKEGDVYLDDEMRYTLSQKYWLDYPELGVDVQPDVQAAIEREESNNPERDEWDRFFGREA